jgi:hypothetical protein
MWYDFYPTNFVFSVPEPWRGDKKHTTSWIKIISHHKPREILFITYIPPHTCFCWLYPFGGHGVGIHNVISKNYHMSVHGKYVINWGSIFQYTTQYIEFISLYSVAMNWKFIPMQEILYRKILLSILWVTVYASSHVMG